MIGGGFMGKAHSNAWSQVGKFFDVDYEIVLKVCVGNHSPMESFAKTWGFEEVSYDWREVVEREDIDVVDIVTPTCCHKEMAIAAIQAGKNVVCEKPFALSYQDSVEVYDIAKQANVVTYLNHNYRKVPAVVLAKQLIDEGRLGTIYHWRGTYLQDWLADPLLPMSWKLKKEVAGGGPLFDLSTHALDLARFLVGEAQVVTAVNKTIVSERPIEDSGDETKTASLPMEKVEVEDASFAIVEFENGALGTIESSRCATGRKNYNDFEVYGSKGAIRFNMERMNELEFFDATQDIKEQGYKKILTTGESYPYGKAWWPPGHIIGYEHSFVNGFADFLEALSKGGEASPNFEDGVKIMRTITAMELSSNQGRRVLVEEVKN